MQQSVILFDGVCNLCNGFVQFVINHDSEEKFKFASLQSDFAKAELPKYNINPAIISTVILLEDGKLYTKSTAALKIARKLGKAWRLFYILIIIPPFIRDVGYNFIAKNRYKWFGQRESCIIPTPELKKRFIS